MKKIISIVLSLAIVLSTLTCVFTGTVSAAEDENYYDLASNYYSYVSGNTLGGEAGGNAPTVDTTAAHTEGESSIKFISMHTRVAAVKLNNIEIGKSYKLNVWYKGTANAARDPASYDVLTPGIYASGTAIGANGTLTGAVSSLADISKVADTDWHEITITFTATSTDLYLAMRNWCGVTFWLDDLTLTEVDLYYETASNYYSYVANNTFGGEAGGAAPTVDSTVAHTEGDSSIKFTSMHGRVAAVKLNNIEVGKSYKLSAWFKSTANTSRTPASYDVLTPGIYASGTAIGTNGTLTGAVSSVADISKVADTDWHEITITFTATSTDLYLAMRIWCGITTWLDDITLTEVDLYYETASNYYSYVANNTLGGEAGGAAPTVDSTVAHTEGDSSIKFTSMHGRVAAVKLKNIEIGKIYKLSAWFKGTANAARTPNSYDVTPGIYASGTAVGTNGILTDAISSATAYNYVKDTDWHEITITFTATSTDLYFAMRNWCGVTFWLDDITVTKWYKEYDYKAYDYENGFFGASFPYTGIVSDYTKDAEGAVTSVISEETENPVSGNSSYKYLWGNPDTNWAFLTPKTAENLLLNNTSYRVSGKYVVQQSSSAVVSMTFGTASALWQTHTQDATARVQALNGKCESGNVYTFNGKITTVVAGYPAMHGYTQGDYTTDYVLLDDIVYAQIIDSVSATSANTSMGSVTVVNKAGYDDYAVNETAVFTAIPANGYYLEGWYDDNGEKVSDDRVYEATLITDTNLTANFAAYDTLYTISFNTNGGNDIDFISNGAGADIVMPANPTKAGFVFAGWYTDEALTNPFTATAFPAENITLYAKWANSYQDFENYTSSPSGNFTVMTDGENAYLGNGYIKYSANAKDTGSRLIVSQTEALKDFAAPGDKIEISFKYKLLSGDARFYMHTSSTANKCTLTSATTQEGKEIWLNVYKFNNVELAVSEEWQTLTVTYDLYKYSECIAQGFDVDDFLYSVFFLSSTNGAELYIDEMALNVIPGEKVKTAYNNAAALRSADASSTGKNGVRIYNEIDTHWVEAKNIVEYGSVAAFASNIEGQITLDNGNKGIAYSDGTLSAEKSSVWEVTDHTVVYTSYLTGIASARYDEDILIRSYAIDADGTVYYGATATVSVFEVANAIDNANTADGSEQTEADAAAFYTFVTSANQSAYAAWCSENGKSVGTLFNNKYA